MWIPKLNSLLQPLLSPFIPIPAYWQHLLMPAADPHRGDTFNGSSIWISSDTSFMPLKTVTRVTSSRMGFRALAKLLSLGINRHPAYNHVGSARRSDHYTIPAYSVEGRDRIIFLKIVLRKARTPKVEMLISCSINASNFNGTSCIKGFAMSAGCLTSRTGM